MNNGDKTHHWGICEICGDTVYCGKCGLNQCSGGRGTLPDGSECDACPSAYDFMMHGTPPATVCIILPTSPQTMPFLRLLQMLSGCFLVTDPCPDGEIGRHKGLKIPRL